MRLPESNDVNGASPRQVEDRQEIRTGERHGRTRSRTKSWLLKVGKLTYFTEVYKDDEGLLEWK